VSGTPEPEDLDAPTIALAARLDAAEGDEALRLETWLWLDGPAQPEGRVGGAARALALDMHRTIQAHGAAADAGESGIEAVGRLDEVRGPVTVAWGDADIPVIIEEARALVAALGPGRARSHVFPGVAHLPSLEVPQAVAELVAGAVRAGGRSGSA
jgi:pimeloyl-ACP methyl ester carboxylesterase